MNLIPSQSNLQDVLYEFSLAKSVPDAQLLDEFVRRFPKYADSLTEFAIELAMDVLKPGPGTDAKVVIDPNHVSPAVSRAMSRFQNRLDSVRKETTQVNSQRLSQDVEIVFNPFAELSREKFRTLATQINANSVFIAKLRDRQIKLDTIPGGFLQRLAEALDITLDLLVAHLAAPTKNLAKQFYKADHQPSSNQQQSFIEAVKNSGLNEDQQCQLLGF